MLLNDEIYKIILMFVDVMNKIVSRYCMMQPVDFAMLMEHLSFSFKER